MEQYQPELTPGQIAAERRAQLLQRINTVVFRYLSQSYTIPPHGRECDVSWHAVWIDVNLSGYADSGSYSVWTKIHFANSQSGSGFEILTFYKIPGTEG